MLFCSLDHLEKQETPSIPDGYTLSIAFACILEIVKGLNTLVIQTSPESPPVQGWIEPDVKDVKDSDTGVGTVSINAMDQGELRGKSKEYEPKTSVGRLLANSTPLTNPYPTNNLLSSATDICLKTTHNLLLLLLS